MRTLSAAMALLLVSTNAFGIAYYRYKDGKFEKIDAAAFASCGTVIYREAAKDELPADTKKALVKALLKGEAKNDLSAAMEALKGDSSACTYGTDAEKFQ